MNNTIFIPLIIALVAIVVIIAILLYNQMLLLNEVNKRLLLMTKESIDKERLTQEELNEALRQLDALTNEQTNNPINSITPEESEEQFNPHTYNPDDL